jgi:hypothetical protein
LKDLKEKYVSLMRQHEKTRLDVKQLEEENKSYALALEGYEGKLKYLPQKMNDKCNEKPLSKQEIVLKDFIMTEIDKSKITSMIYGIYQSSGRGIGFTEGKPNVVNRKSCSDCIKDGLKTYFVLQADKS